jgi:hypothetical protein
MTVNGRSKAKSKTPPRTPAISPTHNRPPTARELWYLECLRILTRHLRRPPKITELALYCDRAVFPTWQGMLRLEAIGLVRREEQEDGRPRFVEVAR